MGALIAGGKAILDLPATLDSAGRGGWLPASTVERVVEPRRLGLVAGAVVGRGGPARRRQDRRAVEEARQGLRPRGRAALPPRCPGPGKLICIGLNYRDHAAESQHADPREPDHLLEVLDLASSGPDDPVVIPRGSEKTDYEAELAFVVGRLAKNVPRDKALRLRVRLLLLQRRQRARLPVRRRAVAAGQVLRHLRADGALRGHRATRSPTRTTWASSCGSTARPCRTRAPSS